MELADRDPSVPAPSRLPRSSANYKEIIDAHRAALASGEDGYDDPSTGHFVFTSAYLATRACCDLGCRHCPYVEE